MSTHDLDERTKRAEFDRLMTAASVHRRRGDFGSAVQTLQQALKIFPDDIDALEFAADMVCARGKLEEAVELYKSIMEREPGRISAEEKFAKATLQIAEAKRQRELMQRMIDNPSAYRPPARSPLWAAILSIAPGFGQIYCGQFVKGAVIFVGVMLSWLLAYAFSPSVVTTLPVGQRIADFMQRISVPVIIFSCIAIFLQIYAFVDAPVHASKMSEDNSKSLSEPQ